MSGYVNSFINYVDQQAATIRDPTVRYVAKKAVDAFIWCNQRITSVFKKISAFFCKSAPKAALDSSRVVCTGLAETPNSVKEFFNPTPAGKIKRVLESLAKTPENKISEDSFLGKGGSRLNREELGSLLHQYLDQMEKSSQDIDLESVQCVKKIIDDLVLADDFAEVEEIESRIKNLDSNFPDRLKNFVGQFTVSFKTLHTPAKEMLKGEGLSPGDLKKIKEHPEYLKNIEIVQKVRESWPNSVKGEILKKLPAAEAAILKKMHQKELNFLKNSKKEPSMIPTWSEFLINKGFEGEIKSFSDVEKGLKDLHIAEEKSLEDNIKLNQSYLSIYRKNINDFFEKLSEVEQEAQQKRIEKEEKFAKFLLEREDTILPATIVLNSKRDSSCDRDLWHVSFSFIQSVYEKHNPFFNGKGLHFQDLEISTEKQLFYAQLQNIWIKYVSAEQLERIVSNSDQKLEMSLCFSDWIKETTGIHLVLDSKSFERIDPSAALDRRQKQLVQRDSLKPLKKNIIKQELVSTPKQIPTVQENYDVEETVSICVASKPDLNVKMGSRNNIHLLQDQIAKIQSTQDRVDRLKLIQNFYGDSSISQMKECRLFVLQWIEEIVLECSNDSKVVQDEVFDLLVSLFDPDCINNERFFKIFVMAVVSGNHAIRLSSVLKKQLLQINQLSELPLDLSEIEETPLLMNISAKVIESLGEIGNEVQRSFIGLEGVDAVTLEESFSIQNLLEAEKDWFNLLCSRSDKLVLSRLQYIAGRTDFRSAEDVAFLRRAILFASTLNKKEVITFLIAFTGDWRDWKIEDFNLNPSQQLFYRDCLLELNPKNQSNIQCIEFIHSSLIEESDLTKKLVGSARQIVYFQRCSEEKVLRKFTSDLEWLLCKIRYQILRETYFSSIEDQKKVQGFVKYAIDQAEDAISRGLQAEFENDDEIDYLFRSSVQSTDAIIKESFETLHQLVREEGSMWTLDRRFLKLGSRIACSLDTGIIYIDGQKFCALPASVKNHPDIRAFGLHKLTFSKSDDGSFVHYVEHQDTQRHAQVVMRPTFSKIAIEKKLYTDFKKNQSKWLEFLPTREFISLTYAVEHHLNIDRFWIDAAGTIYGYDAEEQLVAIFNKGEITISSKCNPFSCNLDSLNESLKTALQAVIPLGDVLSTVSGKEVYIPSIGLSMIQAEDLDKNGKVWRCQGSGFEGMILDVEKSNGYLSLKKDKLRKEVLQQEDVISKLERRLERAQEADLNVEAEYEIEGLEAQIQVEKMKLEEMVGETCLVVLKDPRLYEDEQFNSEVETKYREFVLCYESKKLSMVSLCKRVRNDLENWMIEHRECQTSYERYQQIEEWHRSLTERFLKNHQHTLLMLSRDHLGNFIPKNLLEALFLTQLGEKVDLQSYWVRSELDLATCTLLEKLENQVPAPKYAADLLLQHYLCKLERLSKAVKKNSDEVSAVLNSINSLKMKIHERKKLESSNDVELFIRENEEEDGRVLAQEIHRLSWQSVLSRFHLESNITSTPKNLEMLTQGHKEYIASYNSEEEKAGFYLKEFGYFQLSHLCDEFRIKQQEEGLFNLKKEHVQKILEALALDHIIGVQPYYRVKSQKFDSLRVLAYLNQEGIPVEVHSKIFEYINNFLTRMASAQFKDQFKDTNSQKIVMDQVLVEKKRHFEEMRAAKQLLEDALVDGETLSDLKHAWLTNSKKDQFGPLYNLLTRYLIHKTEWQHLQNIEKAPLQGRGNKIELLKMCRQYPTQLLLEETSTDDQRIQRAFVLFEEECGYRCNPLQYRLFSSLMRSSDDPESIDVIQFEAELETKSLLPLVALVEISRNQERDEEDRSLITVVTSKTTLQESVDLFSTKMSNIAGSQVIQDREFTRYQIDRESPLDSFLVMKAALEHRLEFYRQVRKEGSVLVQSPEIRRSMETQEKELRYLICNNKLQDAEFSALECQALLREILLMKHHFIFDDADDTLNLRSSHVEYPCEKREKIDSKAILLLQEEIKKRPVELDGANTYFGIQFSHTQNGKTYFYDIESKAPFLGVVPYKGPHKPKENLLFANPITAATKTIQYYSSPKTMFEINPHLNFLVSQIEHGIRFEGVQISQEVMKNLHTICNLQGVNRDRAVGEFYKQHMENPSQEFREFFGFAVVSTQLKINRSFVSSDSYGRGSRNNTYKAASRTLQNLPSYFKKVWIAPKGKGSVGIFGRDENQQVQCLNSLDNPGQLIQELLQCANQDTRSIIDAARVCVSRDGDPKTVVKELWRQLQAHRAIKNVRGIIYYAKDGVKKIYFGPGVSEKTYSRESLSDGANYFSFYEQPNIYDFDVNQERKVHKIVTLDEGVSIQIEEVVDEAFHQTCSFAITPNFQKKLNIDPINARTLAPHVYGIQDSSEDAAIGFKKDMVAIVEQAEDEDAYLGGEEYFINQTEDEDADFVGEEYVVNQVEDTINLSTKERFIQELKGQATEQLQTLSHIDKEFYHKEIEDAIIRFNDRFNVALTDLEIIDLEKETALEPLADVHDLSNSDKLGISFEETVVTVNSKASVVVKMHAGSRKNVSLEFLKDLSNLTQVPGDVLGGGTYYNSPDLVNHPTIKSRFIFSNKLNHIFITQQEAALFDPLSADCQTWELILLKDKSLEDDEL